MALLAGENKIFVLDTNVILHDHDCINSFQEHSVVIPITVLEEIDKFKKGNEIINFNAREFSRKLDAMGGDKLLNEGIRLESGGIVVVATNVKRDALLGEIFWEDKPDHRIISLAYNLAKEYGKERVFLVSKDINIRMKAKSIGIRAEDYETGKIQNIDELYKGRRILEDVDGTLIDELFQEGWVSAERFGLDRAPFPNEYFIIRNQSKSTLATYTAEEKAFRHIQKRRAYGIEPRNAEQTFALDALIPESIPLLTLTGRAGTGKTLLALAAALEQRRPTTRSTSPGPSCRSATATSASCPGDVKSKLDPYMQPLWDNISVIRHRFAESRGAQGAPRDDRAREDRDRPARLHPRPLARPRVLHRGRGAEPHAARGEDDHHPRRRGLEGGLHRRHPPDRHALPRQPVERAHGPDRPHEGAGTSSPTSTW